MDFLKQEVMGEEMVMLNRTEVGANPIVKKRYSSNISRNPVIPAPLTPRVLVRKILNVFSVIRGTSQENNFSDKNIDLESKRKILIKKGICFLCLVHTSRLCKEKEIVHDF